MFDFKESCKKEKNPDMCIEKQYTNLIDIYCEDVESNKCQDIINSAPSYKSIQQSKYSRNIFDSLTKDQLEEIEKNEKQPAVSTKNAKLITLIIFIVTSIVLIIYLACYNLIPYNNTAKFTILFGIFSVMIGAFNYRYDVDRFRSHQVPDYGTFDIWTIAHIIRDIFLFLWIEYYMNNALISFGIAMGIAIAFELLESLWDKESIWNKITDLIMVAVGSIVGYVILYYF